MPNFGKFATLNEVDDWDEDDIDEIKNKFEKD